LFFQFKNYNEQSSADLSPQIHQPTLSSSSPSFVADFHTQERERMFNPTNTYTYRLNDFSVAVGPIRAPGGTLSTTPCKGKSHPLLVADRPAYITIIVIVRDAVARLRNGEGTRQHICELVKESQFINQVPINLIKNYE
jgi:nuclear factor related to kappa-B-binding protein